MEYRVIDRSNWQRKEYFEHYLKVVPCTYSITTKLDITAIKKQRLKLYPTMLYCITKIVIGMKRAALYIFRFLPKRGG